MSITLNDTLGVKRDIKHYDFGMPFWEATRQKKLAARVKATYAGEISAVQGLCGALPSKASVVFVNVGQSKSGNELAEVVRGICDKPAAIANDATSARVAILVHGIRQAGRVPVLLGGYGRALAPYGGVPHQIMALHTAIDGESLTVPPTNTTPFNLAVWMTVPPT